MGDAGWGMGDGDEGWGMRDGAWGMGILWGEDGGMEGRGEIDGDEDSERKGRIKGIAEAGAGLLMLLRVCVSGIIISRLTQYQHLGKRDERRQLCGGRCGCQSARHHNAH